MVDDHLLAALLAQNQKHNLRGRLLSSFTVRHSESSVRIHTVILVFSTNKDLKKFKTLVIMYENSVVS